jgi:hypothetical protein
MNEAMRDTLMVDDEDVELLDADPEPLDYVVMRTIGAREVRVAEFADAIDAIEYARSKERSRYWVVRQSDGHLLQYSSADAPRADWARRQDAASESEARLKLVVANDVEGES